jgi:phenylalanyl-tRNA synthetase alpha chain
MSAPAELSSDALEQALLSHLAVQGVVEDTWSFAQGLGVDHQAVVGVLKSLLVDQYVADEPLTASYWTLTEEGNEIASIGSAEFRVYSAVPAEGGADLSEVQARVGEAVTKIGLGQCMKNKWLKKDGEKIVRLASDVKDTTRDVLLAVQQMTAPVDEEEMKNLKRRKLVQQVVRKSFRLSKGPCFRPVRARRYADLTKDMLGNKNEVGMKAILHHIY